MSQSSLLNRSIPIDSYLDPRCPLSELSRGDFTILAPICFTKAIKEYIIEKDFPIKYGIIGKPYINSEITNFLIGLFHLVLRLVLNTTTWTLTTALELKMYEKREIKENIDKLIEKSSKLYFDKEKKKISKSTGKSIATLLKIKDQLIDLFPNPQKELLHKLWDALQFLI